MELDGKIKNHWNNRARDFARRADGEMGDTLYDENLRTLEIQNISKYLRDGLRVLDIGCGNGYSTIRFASTYRIEIDGMDYSEEMVRNAHLLLEKKKAEVLGGVRFLQGNVLEPNATLDATYDAVITERCLINLGSWENQRAAIRNIHRYLKPGGRFLMLEGFHDNLEALNAVRARYDLPPINVVWHNVFFRKDAFEKEVSALFDIEATDNYGSTYMLISRTIFHVLQGQEGTFDKALDYLATLLPNFGDFNYQTLHVLRRK